MADTQKRGTSVLGAVLLVVLTAVALGAVAFYFFFGGADLLNDMLGRSKPEAETVTQEPGTTGSGLVLPAGMTEAHALRMWQEQIESQRNIEKLVDGEIEAFDIGAVAKVGTSAKVDFTCTFTDGSSAPGTMSMSRAGSGWFVSSVGGMRSPEDTGMLSEAVNTGRGEEPTSALPTVSEVDVETLNAVIEAQADDQEMMNALLDGDVRRIVVDEVRKGPNTATAVLSVVQRDGTSKAEIVCLSRSFRGETRWLMAGFERKVH